MVLTILFVMVIICANFNLKACLDFISAQGLFYMSKTSVRMYGLRCIKNLNKVNISLPGILEDTFKPTTTVLLFRNSTSFGIFFRPGSMLWDWLKKKKIKKTLFIKKIALSVEAVHGPLFMEQPSTFLQNFNVYFFWYYWSIVSSMTSPSCPKYIFPFTFLPM